MALSVNEPVAGKVAFNAAVPPLSATVPSACLRFVNCTLPVRCDADVTVAVRVTLW